MNWWGLTRKEGASPYENGLNLGFLIPWKIYSLKEMAGNASKVLSSFNANIYHCTENK